MERLENYDQKSIWDDLSWGHEAIPAAEDAETPAVIVTEEDAQPVSWADPRDWS